MNNCKSANVKKIHRNTKDQKDYYKQLYVNNMDNLEENKFLQRYNLPRLNQGKVDSMNGPIKSSEIKNMIKKLPTGSSHCGSVG